MDEDPNAHHPEPFSSSPTLQFTSNFIMHLLVSWFLTILVVTAAPASAFEGYIQLYRDINYNHQLVLFAFYRANRCFNIAACYDYNNIVSSAKWSGLPATATYDGATKAKIAFYVFAGCKGESKSYSTTLNSVRSFAGTGLNDMISSFMVLEYSEDVEDGESSLCTLESGTTSADVNTTVADGSEQVLLHAEDD